MQEHNEVKDLIILGCGQTYPECDYHCEVWGVNGTYNFAKRLDKLFMTDEESEVEECWYDLVKMTKSDTTLVLPARYKRFVKLGLPIEIFPMEEVLQKFPTKFYSNTICYMMAYALLKTQSVEVNGNGLAKVTKGYDKIYFYGIDMTTNSTYLQEKGGVEFWMGIALGMGVKVINTRGSATGKTWNGRMYGHYGQTDEEKAKERLYAPWEMVRTLKAADVQEGTDHEWIRTGDGWTKVPVPMKVAGNEVNI